MVFSSTLFLFVFLPCFLASYFLSPKHWRNDVALLWSLLFYAWGAPRFVFALVFSSSLDYVIGALIYRCRGRKAAQSWLLAFSVVANISLLFYFKYANFFVSQLNELLNSWGHHSLAWTPIALPIGISFFTFHKLSYTIDVYRGLVEPARNYRTFLLYLALFPQLIAGPIIRYHIIEQQLRERLYSWEMFFEGVSRFSIGLAKKVLIADAMAGVADMIFAMPAATLPTSYAWLGALSYSFQIYFDFSGYSDMAVGLGLMMGFRFPENFNSPYIAESITDFWRRWHITLSSWMREYLYIPLGGNRVGIGRVYLNLWIVFFLSGLWHGANWTFVVWGLFHGLLLVLDRLLWLQVSQRVPRLLKIGLTYILVVVGWVFFRSDSIGDALHFLHRLFEWHPLPKAHSRTALELLTNRSTAMFLLAAILSFMPASQLLDSVKGWVKSRLPRPLTISAQGAFVCLLFVLAAANITNSHFHPFIYFRF